MDQIPRLYETESIPMNDKVIHMHFFLGSADWFVAEYDGWDIFFGYANWGNPDFAEWGYMSFGELKELRTPEGFEVDRDLDWVPKKVNEIPEIKGREG
ncbi:MAG: DUF2958 domain-containing protein [Methanophagales archaeon]|nr:DUF2958 domain-containing protein [Methanophagales archaeon]